MSSTNKTSNYELSQFLGTDKPAWLQDYNADMSKIDAQMKLNADAASSAAGTATSASTAVGTLSSLETTDKTSAVAAINEVNTNAGTAQNTATAAYGKASANETAITGLNNEFNFGSPTTYGVADLVRISGAAVTIPSGSLTLVKNTNGTMFKLYGNFAFEASTVDGSVTIRVTEDSGLRPTSEITINQAGCSFSGESDTAINIVVKTTGEIDLVLTKIGTNKYQSNRLWPCLYFVKDFGDIPSSNQE